MKKKIIILSGAVFILLLLAGGVFLWLSKINKEGVLPKSEFVNSADYAIGTTLSGRIIENKKEGLVAEVPENWAVKNYNEGLGLFSPDADFNQNGWISSESAKEKGACGIMVQIIKYYKADPELETFAEYKLLQINEAQKDPEKAIKEGIKVVKISNNQALEKRVDNKDGSYYIKIEVPVLNKIYFFNTGPIFSNKCYTEFSNFIEKISIN